MGRGRRKSESQPKGQEAESTEVKIEGGGIGAFGLQEAPVFYPTDEEFENPLRYIAQIRPEAEAFGICRIVPPPSWNPPFGLDTVKFTFPTKLQAIHHLQERPAACDADTFKLEYSRFLRKQGETLERWPHLDGQELDLCKLFNAVKRHGGHDKVTSENRWGEVVRMVTAGASSLPSSSISSTLRQLYETHLSTFEVYQTKVGAGKRWRAKPKQESPEKPVNKFKRGGRKRQSGGGVDLDASGDSKKDESDETELYEVLLPASEVETRSQAKRMRRRRQSGVEADLDAEEITKRESVENNVAGGLRASVDVESRAQPSPPAQRKRRKMEEKFAVPEEVLGRTDQICEQCHSGAHEQLMLLCDRCDRGWHLYCLSPPLSSVPVGNWYCLECLGSESESFGFGQGHEYSFDSFRRMADRFKRKWFGSRPSSYTDLEKEFWRVVERGTAPVEVLYGSDLDTGVYGSGFPRASDPVPAWSNADAWDAGARNPWNVNNFPTLEGSMLRLVHDNIPGVMVPWLYIGMMFSSFCWHYEDHCFYSVNYLHCGEPKSWYSVPGTAAEEFEKVMRSAFPDLFEAQPDLLFQLVTMLSPTVLRENGVPVFMTIQEPRNFVITFPRSYHGGFNHGFNCAEAVNFAPSDWLPYGGFGVERYRLYHKAAVLSHDELLCVVAKSDASCRSSPWLQQELSRIVTKERHQREFLWSLGMVKSARMTPRPNQDHIGAEEDAECIICRYYLHLSAVICRCRPGKAVCLQHARQLCECSADQQSLLYRFTLAELDDLIGSEDQLLEDCKVGDLAAASSNNKRRLRRGQNGASSLTSPLVKKVKGRPYRYAELADTWLSQARVSGRSHLRSPVLEDLLSQAEQFLWGGHEMDKVREMVHKLNVAHKWVQDIAACSAAVGRHGHGSSAKALKVPLATVENLVAVDPVPWVEPHLQTLKALFEPARRLDKQIVESLTASSPLEIRVLQALQQESNHLPFELPGTSRLKDVLSGAQAWSDRVRKLLSTSSDTKALRNHAVNDQTDLQQLRALHSEGLDIPVIVPEKALLESAIRSAEIWQQDALKLLGSSCTTKELVEVLRESESLAVHLVEVDLLEVQLQRVKRWIQDAGHALEQVKHQINYVDSIKCLVDLLQYGRGLLVSDLEEIDLLEVELEKVSWMHSASQALLDYPTISCLQDHFAEATRLEVADEKLALQILATLEDASAWESKAEHVIQSGGSLDVFTELASAAEGIHARLSGLDHIKKSISEARSWLERAWPFCQPLSNPLKEKRTQQLELSTLKVLVADAKNLSISLEEGGLLCTVLAAAEAWVSRARILKTSVLVGEHSENKNGCTVDLNCEDRGVAEYKNQDCCHKKEKNVLTTSRLERDLCELQAAVDEGLVLGIVIPDIAELQSLCRATKWNLEARRLVGCTPTVKEVESHLEDGTNLLVMEAEYSLLQSMVVGGKAWLQAAAAFLPGFGVKGSYTEEELEQLIADAQLLPVSVVSEAACLADILASHRSWKTKVQHVLTGTTCLTWSELLKLQEAGEADMVLTEEENSLNHEVLSAGSWMLSCHEAIARQPTYSGATLEDLLLKMKSSVDFAIQYLATDDIDKRDRTCVCRRVLDRADNSLVQCDSCQNWYHPSCLGVTQAQTRGQRHYICPYCIAVSSGVLFVNKDLCSQIYVTQRPHLTVLRELLSSARVLRCRIKEKELLEGVVKLVQLWQRRVQIVIKPALICGDMRTTVNNHSLVAAQKSVEAMEVQEEEGSLLQAALAANVWRSRAIKLLEDHSKPLLRTLTRTLKEGLAIPVSGEDRILRELQLIEERASLWAIRAKQVIGDHGRMPLVEVQALILEGEELPVALSKELSSLRERSVLYCVCRKPYDEDRAMIACDRCEEWYHYSCINLPEPDDCCDEHCDDAIQLGFELSGDFVCPICEELVHQKLTDVPSARPPDRLNRNRVPHDRDNSNKEVEGGPFNGLVRGKRSNRSSNRSRGESHHRWQSPLFAPGKLLWHTQKRRKQHEQADGSVSTSGRPCRRTAGRHSGFESFVLLMRSR